MSTLFICAMTAMRIFMVLGLVNRSSAILPPFYPVVHAPYGLHVRWLLFYRAYSC